MRLPSGDNVRVDTAGPNSELVLTVSVAATVFDTVFTMFRKDVVTEVEGSGLAVSTYARLPSGDTFIANGKPAPRDIAATTVFVAVFSTESVPLAVLVAALNEELTTYARLPSGDVSKGAANVFGSPLIGTVAITVFVAELITDTVPDWVLVLPKVDVSFTT